MSTTAAFRPAAQPRAWQDFQRPALQQMARIFRNWRATRRAERELSALDDRTLKDIGLTRSEIRRAVRDQLGAAGSLPFAR